MDSRPFNMQPKTSARLSRRGKPSKQAQDSRSGQELSARAQRAAERAKKRQERTVAADKKAKKKHKKVPTLSTRSDVAPVQPRHRGRQPCRRHGCQQRDQQQTPAQQQDRRITEALEMMHRQQRLLDDQQLQLEQIRSRLCDMQTWHCRRRSSNTGCASNAGRSNSDTHGPAAAPIMANTRSWFHSPPADSKSQRGWR